MLHDSPTARVDAADGIATLRLAFPGRPVNALTPARLAAIDRALSAVEQDPHVEILVVRSDRPAGFCGGHDPHSLRELTAEADQTAFAAAGQRVLNRLAEAAPITLAFIEGPCLGPGLELALACDYRLAVAGTDSWVGFPDAAAGLPPCWGATARLGRLVNRRAEADLLAGKLLTAREAQRVGLIDDAFSVRRGKIELRAALDRLQFKPRKRRDSLRRAPDQLVRWLRGERIPPGERLAAERVAFRAALRNPAVVAAVAAAKVADGSTPWPEFVGLPEGDLPAVLAVETALRGSQAIVTAGHEDGIAGAELAIGAALAEAVRRGRATPLEAEQARARITITAGFPFPKPQLVPRGDTPASVTRRAA